MKCHFPCLALTLATNEHNKNLYSDVRRSYDLEKYILTGSMSESVI